MYKSPLFMLLAALVMFVMLNGLASLCLLMDASVLAVGIGAILLTLVSCVAIAAKDPTYKVTYWYSFTFAIAAVGSSANATRPVEILGLGIGVLYLTATWATYQLRKRNDIQKMQASCKTCGI